MTISVYQERGVATPCVHETSLSVSRAKVLRLILNTSVATLGDNDHVSLDIPVAKKELSIYMYKISSPCQGCNTFTKLQVI
jgi:hypothetical protein